MGTKTRQNDMDRILRLNEFFVEGGKPDISHVLIHIIEPSTPEEMEKGYFFAICELNNAAHAYSEALKEIIEEAENDYYETEDQPDKNALELILEKINQRALALSGNSTELHCIIGAIRSPEIMFTYSGRPHMLLFYKNQQGFYEKMDLVDSDEQIDPGAAQLFSHIIQGKINSSDFLFAGTPNIGSYFNHDRIQKIITTRPAHESSKHIERVLSEIKNGYSFGGLILTMERTEQSPVPVKKIPLQARTNSSSTPIFLTEKNTANTLSSSILPQMQNRLNTLFNRTPEVYEKKPARPTITQPTTQINASHVRARPAAAKNEDDPTLHRLQGVVTALQMILTTLAKGLWTFVLIIYTIIYSIIRNVILLFFALTNFQRRRALILEDWRRQWRSIVENLKLLPLFTKLLVIAALLVTSGVTGGIFYYKADQRERARVAAFTNTVDAIRNKKDSMESALIYKDTTAAFNELASAQTLLKELVCVTPEEQTTCTNLKTELDSMVNRVRKLSTVETTLIANWSEQLPGSAPDQIIKIGSKIVGFSSSTSTLVVLDLLNKETIIVPTYPNISGFITGAVPKENDYALLVYDKNKILKFNPSDNTVAMAEISFPEDDAAIAGAVIYNRRLYALDVKNNQIYRHDTIKNGFGVGKEWLKGTGTPLSEGTSITIDGDVFVTNNNAVIKFTSGNHSPFTLQGLDPELQEGGTIWTYNDINQLYVLDPANKRLIILEKDGRLREQLTANTFIKPTGMVIDAPGNTAYVVDGGKLLSISLIGHQ